jgi:DNA-binding response OmpR family regulator
VGKDREALEMRSTGAGETSAPAHPTVLLVDDNRDLLQFLQRLMAESGWELLAAENASEARKIVAKRKPNAALLDYMLPDGNGVELAQQLRGMMPRLPVIMMTGSVLGPEEEAICEEHDFPVLRKPFLATDVMNQIRARITAKTKTGR